MAKKNYRPKKTFTPKTEVSKKPKVSCLIFKEGMTLKEVAEELGISPSVLLDKLMNHGFMISLNNVVSRDICEIICVEFNLELQDEVVTDLVRFDEIEIVDKPEDLKPRAPVVTIMGHVDHGKTTLLDRLRNSHVVASEAGGITQHIGAYQIMRNNKSITFIDTPGHAAFTEMRARGAKVTDITILVVAADDGVMPQTEEAIAHAKSAGVPIIVAINKMDKVGANPDRVTQELANLDLMPEAWGGKTIYVKISALKGEGIEELLDMIELTAEVEELKANPSRLAYGTVIEAKMDKGRGPVATLIIGGGTLRKGDNIVLGDTFGKVRTMTNDRGKQIDEALPSMPVEITGINEVPLAGDKFIVIADERKAKQISDARKDKTKMEANVKNFSLDQMFSNVGKKDLNVIVKADTQGSAEAIKSSLLKLSIEDVNVNIIRCSAGIISETDITLATVSKAIIIGFNIRPSSQVREQAKDSGVEIRFYNIIYKMIEDIEKAVNGLLEPIYEDVVIGVAEVRSIFKSSKTGVIAGCYVIEGKVERNSLVRLLRNQVVIYEGKMASLKRFKDDAKEVSKGYECGITIENYSDIKEGDLIEASVSKEVER